MLCHWAWTACRLSFPRDCTVCGITASERQGRIAQYWFQICMFFVRLSTSVVG